MSILSLLSDRIEDSEVERMSQQIGASPSTTRTAVQASLPLLIGALARNANTSPDAAEALDQAVDRDHDGSMVDHLSSLIDVVGQKAGTTGGLSDGGLGSLFSAAESIFSDQITQKTVDGSGILGHLLGARRSALATGVARISGLDASQTESLLELLAPMVMSALAREKDEKNLGAEELAQMLDDERQAIERSAPGMDAGQLLQLLDREGDGSMADDIADIGSQLRGLF